MACVNHPQNVPPGGPVASGAGCSGGGEQPPDEEHIYDTATDIKVEFDVQDDGTWSYDWMWTYGGNRSLSGVATELIVKDSTGRIVDVEKESPHSMEPGVTALGGGRGSTKKPQGRAFWELRIPYGSGYIGMAGGRLGEDQALQPGDRVLDTATAMEAHFDVNDDGTFTYGWLWTYNGNKHVTGIVTELLVTDGRSVGPVFREPAHAMEPGQTALGSGSGGAVKLPAGKIDWLLSIPYQDGTIGQQRGSFFCAANP